MKLFEDFEYGIHSDYTDYQKKEGKRDYAVIFKYMGNNTKVTVPTEIEGIPVTTMVDSFTKREEMEEIILPEKLEKISYGCFRECNKITKTTLPETLISIGPEAFSGCTSLEEVICPENPQWLEQISLGDRDLGQNIFVNCPKLCDENGFVLLHSLLVGYDGRNTEIAIPATVTKIADFAFWEQKKLKTISVPDSVKTLGRGVFFKCQGLKEINLPDGIKIFPDETFRRCTSLESIVFPEKLEKIHHDVFHGCTKLKNIHWNENVKIFWDGTFSKCTSLEEIHFPNSLEDIGKAFTGCDKLKEITIPANVTIIHEKAFAKCKNLEIVTFAPRPDGMEGWLTTQTGCFAYTIPMQERFLTQGEAPQSRVIFGFNKADEEKFQVDQIKMWEHLSVEEKDFFLEDWKLKISGKNRKGKNRLRNLVFLKSTAKEMSVYFNEGCHLELPELEDYLAHSVKEGNTAETALLLDYKNKTFDKTYLEEQETHKEMVEIGLEMPTLAELRVKWKVVKKNGYLTISEYLGKEKSEVLPDGIDTGEYIRYLSCPKKTAYHPLEKLVLPEKLEKFLHMCFSASPMKEIVLPRSLTVIHKHMFNNSVNLEKIEFHEGIKSIENMAFRHCFALKEIHFPESLEYIGESAFERCLSLKTVTFTKSLKKIDKFAFTNCDGIEEIILPKDLELLGECAFFSCVGLKRVILPSYFTEYTKNIFHKCKSLEFIGTENGENIIDRFVTKE